MFKSKHKSKKVARGDGTVTGIVLGHREGFGFVQASPDDVYLDKFEMRNVFPGDLVRVEVGRTDRNGRAQGSIIEVIQHNTTQLVGQFVAQQGAFSLVPEKKEIGVEVCIPNGSEGAARHGQMVVVEVVRQPSRVSTATAKVIEVLGDKMDAGMEIQIAIRSFGIPHLWPKSVTQQAAGIADDVLEADKLHRNDLRDLPLVTIDGEDARDFDDAVYCKKTRSGWTLWVAIADVSHYVKPGSPLDQEAENRSTSVYFPDYVVPMLPEKLSNGLCSLNPNVDRLALVCEMAISSKGEIKKFQFSEAVIRSHARLTYQRVWNYLSGQDVSDDPDIPRVADNLKQLHGLFETLFQRRQARGALEFETVETRVIFDANRKISKIVPSHRNDAHKLIEECMLCANICAAEFLTALKIPGLYRVHPAPVDTKLEALRATLGELGLNLGGGDKPSPKDFKALVDAIEHRPDKQVIQSFILRAQQQAVYQPENLGHFGLAYEAYAHFTSPIRRYPDLLVHRAIRSVIRGKKRTAKVLRIKGAELLEPKTSYPYDASEMDRLGELTSTHERRAEEATRDVMQWLKCEYLSARVGEKFVATVTAVTHFGLFMELDNLYVEGLAHVTALPDDYYDFEQAAHCLVGRTSGRTFKMGDRCLVQVARVSLEERKIDLVFADSDDTRGGAEPRRAKNADWREKKRKQRSVDRAPKSRKSRRRR